MASLLDIVVEVIQADEEQGKESLEALIELTNLFGEIWKDCGQKLIFVSSEVMKNRDFEDGTRETALEIIISVAEAHPKLLKENVETMKSQFFPSLCVMMTKLENEDDLEAWYKVEEEDIFLSNDIASHAAESLERLVQKVGEAMTIQCCTQLINEMVKGPEWQTRHAGFMCLGMIAEVCERSFRQNIANVMLLHSPGLQDEHPRVRYQALMSMGRLMNYACPELQFTYHADLMPMLLRRMTEETQIKMKAQVVSTSVSFVTNLTGTVDQKGDDAVDPEIKEEGKKIIMLYSEALVQNISVLFQLSIDQAYSPLQEETLVLLSSLAELLSDLFANHYGTFMPGLMSILQNTPSETQQQKDLRSSCIASIGTIFESVKDQPEVCRADAHTVMQSFGAIMTSMN